MRDPSSTIIDSVYTALNGNLSYGGTNWPVYTSSPSGTDYVLIGGLDITDDSAKSIYLADCSLEIHIVDGGNNKVYSKKPANDIADDIIQRLCYVALTFTNWAICVRPYLESSQQYEETTDTEIVFRKVLRFNFTVQQTL